MFRSIPLLLVVLLWLAPAPALAGFDAFAAVDWQKFIDSGEEALLDFDYERAEEQFLASIKEAENLLSHTDRPLVESLVILASTYSAQKKFNDAIPLLERRLDLDRKLYKRNDPSLAQSDVSAS